MDEKEKVINAFQEAARKVMIRINRDDRFAHVMYGTDCYDSIITAYAQSLGKTLPEMSSLKPVVEIWNLLHLGSEV